MEKKNRPALEEFETFKTEQEKGLWKFFLIGDILFLIFSFILMVVGKLGIVSWFRYWILIGGNIFLFFLFFLSFIKNFKVWLLKYIVAICAPLLIGGWIYSTDPNYAKSILIFSTTTAIMLGFLFYDLKVLFLSATTTMIIFGLLFLYHFKIGTTITFNEILIFLITLPTLFIMSFIALKRTRLFLYELLQKRNELEEKRTALEIKVKARTQELEELTQTLDQRIKERTQELEKSKEELQGRVDELERFHKLTIGRELKMAELKERIKELEEKSEKDKKS